MNTDFSCRISNQIMLYTSILRVREGMKILKRGGLSANEMKDIADAILDGEDVIAQASTFPDVGIA